MNKSIDKISHNLTVTQQAALTALEVFNFGKSMPTARTRVRYKRKGRRAVIEASRRALATFKLARKLLKDKRLSPVSASIIANLAVQAVLIALRANVSIYGSRRCRAKAAQVRRLLDRGLPHFAWRELAQMEIKTLTGD